MEEQIENEKYRKFFAQKEKMEQDIKAKKLEQEAIKQQIFEKLSAEEKERRRQQDELDDLR